MLRHRIQTRRALRRHRAAASLLAAAAAFAGVAAGTASAGDPSTATTSAQLAQPWEVNSAMSGGPAGSMYETFAPDGSITLKHGIPAYRVPRPLPVRLRAGGSGPVVTDMHHNGDSTNRIDLVFVGDGYLATEQGTFNASAERAWQALMNYEPYKTYQKFFNAERVNINSPVSGISNDPTNGLSRATPLGMHFYCHDIERLLCVNTKAATAYASLVPGISHVVALGHTTTYGGAGGAITTLAGENSDSDGVIVHEMAHTIAGLGDEYQVPYDVADGSSTPLVNNSSRVQSQMVQDKTKWYRWLGKPSADGGTVGAYEGSNYYAKGYFRPSINSEMRSLGQPFNPPSIEALIESFYVSRNNKESINPIDSVTPVPDNNGISSLNTTLSASLIPLVGQDYTVYWGVNGVAVPNSLGATSLNLATAPLTKGKWNQVSIYVIDNNPAVQDEAFRMANMTKTKLWWVWGG